MFATAKILKTGPVSAKAKKEPTEIKIEGIEAVAALDTVIKSLMALKETYEAQAKGNMVEEFVTLGTAKGGRPDNFRGVEGMATASCEMRARSSRSPFQPDEVAILTGANVPLKEVVDGVETYGINPTHLGSQQVMTAMEKALQPLVARGKLPTDLFVKLEPPKRTVLGEDAIDIVFKSGDKTTIRQVLPIITTLAIKPTLGTDTKTADAFKLVEKLMANSDDDQKAAA